MTFPIVIALDGPPRAKGRPRFRVMGKFVSTYTDSATRNYEDDLKIEAVRVMRGKPPLDCPLVVNIVAYVPIPDSWSKKKRQMAQDGLITPVSRPDIDNYGKIGLDSLNSIVWRDDSLVIGLSVWKFYSTAPRLTIKVEPWGPKIAGTNEDLACAQ